MQKDQSSFAVQQRNQKRHHERSQSTSISHNSSNDHANAEPYKKKRQKDFSKSINPQLANDKFENKYDNFESDNNASSIDLVEMKVNKIASVFGANQSITNFLEKTKELKIIPNISHLNHTKDLFSQMVNGIQHIRIRNYLPKDLKGLSCPIIQQRLKSMRQVRSFELAINFMRNEFDFFNHKILANSDDLDHNISDKIESLSKENEKLREKVNLLQKQIKDKIEENTILTERKVIILQIKDLLMKINSQKEKNIEDAKRISEKLDKFSESREKLLSSYKLTNKQIKKLEKAKFSILEKNAKTVTIKGKVYNDKTIDDEIAQFMSKKESILNGLDKIETHERKLLSSMKSAYDE